MVTSCESRGRDAGNVNVPRGRPRFRASSSCVAKTRSTFATYSAGKVDRAPLGPDSGLKEGRNRDVPGVSLTPSSWIRAPGPVFRTGRSRKWETVSDFRRTPGLVLTLRRLPPNPCRPCAVFPRTCRTCAVFPRTVPTSPLVPCVSPRTPRVPGVSWRPHPAGVATRRPGRNSDGRGSLGGRRPRTAGAA